MAVGRVFIGKELYLKTFFAWFAYLVFCGACLSAGTAASVLEKHPVLLEMIKQSNPIFRKPDPFAGMEELTVLVLGCDQELYYGGKQVIRQYARTDTIQIIRFDFKHKAIGMMQVPRDTVVHVPGFKTRKVNALFVAGGVKPRAPFDLEAAKSATTQGVKLLTGISPDRVIVLNYKAIQEMIDQVGGVEVYIPKKMNYEDVRGNLRIHLKPGRQLLNGQTAIGFLRWRKDSDFNRGDRQQEFMMAFKQKVVGAGRDLSVLAPLSNLALKVVNGGMSTEEFVALGKFAQQVPPATIKRGRLPVEQGEGTELVPLAEQLPKALVESGLKDPVVTVSTRSR